MDFFVYSAAPLLMKKF